MQAADQIEQVRDTAEYQRLFGLLSNREWRLDNLYRIKGEDGQEIPFVRNEAQRAFSAAAWCRNVIPKARKLGFSTFIAVDILDECLFRRGSTGGIVDQSLDDATDKLAMINYAYERLPSYLRSALPLKRCSDSYMEWGNGSSVSVGTSYRGGTPTLLHVSEYGPISANTPEAANEILTGAIQAVPVTGRAWVESTTHGTGGRFYEMVERARKSRDEKRQLTALDFRFHFFGWWIKREYRLPVWAVTISHEVREYFADLQAKHGIICDPEQVAWYAKKLEELGPDDMKSEFPSCDTELFFSSIQGAYFKDEVAKARREGRIGQPMPHDPTRPVHTYWDIGEDCTAVGFAQTDGVRWRHVDYYEEEGGSLQKAIKVLDDKRRDRGFVYGKHYGPHDLENRDWGNNAVSRYQTALGLGVKFDVVPQVGEKEDAIEAERRLLNVSWFDSVHCGLLVDRIENYRKRWNKTLSVFTRDPVHDMPSHGNDAMQQLAMGREPEREKRGRPPRDKGKGTAMSA